MRFGWALLVSVAACSADGGPRAGIYAVSFEDVGGDCEREIHSAPEALGGWPPARRWVQVGTGVQPGDELSFGHSFGLQGDGWSCAGSFSVAATAGGSGIDTSTAVLESSCNERGTAACRHEFSASFSYDGAAPDAGR